MANIWKKNISILAGNLNLGDEYLITTVKVEGKKIPVLTFDQKIYSATEVMLTGTHANLFKA
jgi:hypothetical protein